MSASHSDRPLLIVNADDYGLTDGVSAAIVDAAERGIVTSTSVIALGPGFGSSVRRLADVATLGVGVHFAAVGEDPPLLSAAEIPSLVDRSGRLWASWRQFLPRAASGRINPDDLAREFSAQLDAVRGAGVDVDHIDTHQNLHLWPMVRDVVMGIGDTAGVQRIRVTRSGQRGPVGVVVRRLARDLEAVCDAKGWRYTTASTGLDEAGTLDADGMVASLGRLRAGAGFASGASAELATHPGVLTDGDRAHYQWGYRWEEEYAALCSPNVRDAVDRLGFRLGTFADLGSA